MLTVRTIDTLGDESIYQTKTVSTKTNRKTKLIESLFFHDEAGFDTELKGSYRVYIMNENGRTVAKYNMGTFLEADRGEE